ncbi:hypothetical protein QMZ92_33820 [Streptomyces sp. HNM0645]|uniref:hypothetical protein n=1 Tax=Streptomyces sp. HNM0645 TaxID=2782343 RepID=UPI0024B78A50|nr:hypothetical protein [Streptomyces sp. HNM0645]MDI9889181.1 hypothetical protein [Streptomyces sp. HNM0645]
MTTRFDDGPDFGPDDPLSVILRPTPDHLGPPPGRYEAIRRTATRRRVLRAAVGVGLASAVAALIALPLHLTAPGTPTSPTVPLAPLPASSPTPPATPPTSPHPSVPAAPWTDGSRAPSGSEVRPTHEPPAEPTPSQEPTSPPSSTWARIEPSASQ